MDENLCVKDCEKCSNLVDSRSQIVNGVGPLDANIVMIGEAPGETEDETGKPFMGRSGDVLDDELESNGINRDNIRITNVVRCRPPDNRDPYKSEIKNCNTYLNSELYKVNPDVILTLGRIPTETLIETDKTITQIAGEVFEIEIDDRKLDVVAGVHPAATLYNSSYKDTFKSQIKECRELISY